MNFYEQACMFQITHQMNFEDHYVIIPSDSWVKNVTHGDYSENDTILHIF